MSDNTDKILLTTEEVASILRLSKRQVYELIRSNELQSVKLGHRSVRVKQSDLDNYINQLCK